MDEENGLQLIEYSMHRKTQTFYVKVLSLSTKNQIKILEIKLQYKQGLIHRTITEHILYSIYSMEHIYHRTIDNPQQPQNTQYSGTYFPCTLLALHTYLPTYLFTDHKTRDYVFCGISSSRLFSFILVLWSVVFIPRVVMFI